MKEYTNAEKGITSLLWEMGKGYAVALRDDDSGETLDPVTIFPHKMENSYAKAQAHALKIANLNQ